jgi:probable F420-dependent oxidoreductase
LSWTASRWSARRHTSPGAAPDGDPAVWAAGPPQALRLSANSAAGVRRAQGVRGTIRTVGVAIAVELPTARVDPAGEFTSAQAIAEIAGAAEEAGFDACFVTDHPAGDATWLDTGGHHAFDPFVALSFAAAATTRLRLLTHILVLAYRNPFLTAKGALSLDILSGGRLILGTAAGYLRPEFGALGVDFDERNELAEEAIEVIRLAWSGEDVSYEGRHFRARGVRMRPLPVSGTGPPIWMGGNSTRAIRRAVELCQGWAPFPSRGISRAAKTAELSGLDDLRPRIELARSYADEIGRKEPLDICWALHSHSGPDEAKQLDAEGITWATVGFAGDTRAAYIDNLRRFAERVIR